ncbi:hypothetical protein ACP70R_032380 [Stipagrostis hirtigluma subsp. patula]
MTEEEIKEVITSTSAAAERKCEGHLINAPVTIDGKSAPPDIKRKEKPVPHYLRASSSSCHDNCKFGIQHSSESKKYQPIRRAQLRRASTGNCERDRVEIILPQRSRTRKEDQKLKISHAKDGSATPAKPEFSKPKAPLERASDHPEISSCVVELPAEASEPIVASTLPIDAECCIISHGDVADLGDGESSDGAVSIELEMPLAIQDSDVSDEHIEDAILPTNDICEAGERSPVVHVSEQSANQCAGLTKSTPLTVMASEEHGQADHGTKTDNSPKKSVNLKTKATSSMNRNTASTRRNGRTSDLKATGADVQSSGGPKSMRKKAAASSTTKISRPEKKCSSTVASSLRKVKETKVPSPANAADSSAKPAKLSKPKALMAKNATSPSLTSGKQNDRKMALKNVTKNAQVLQKKGEVKAVPRPVKLSRSVNMPAKSLSSIRVRTVKREKIAPPIKSDKKVAGTEKSATDAKEKVVRTASTKVQKSAVINKETRSRKEKPDTPRTATVRRTKPAPITPSSTATQPPPRKLTFRRGKVLNPDDGSGGGTPRLLRFRPAKVTAEASGRGRGGVRTSGRKGGSSAAAARDAAGAPRAEVVVLRRRRHDDGRGDGKRQQQVLLNNVIEETASRLVAEARKSKVKALVGAFETVISLQEGSKAAPAAAAAVAP